MMKNKLIILIIALFGGGISLSAQTTGHLEPDGTYLYERRDTCDLFLDVYNPARGSETTFMGISKPTVLFMFGGGFIQGTRDDKSYNSWFRMLTENGYRVISIDYRLGLKGSSKVGIAQVNVLDKAIHMAVEDLFSATNFMIENADQLGIETDNIVISGSSAGAISVMQAEYEIANRTSWASVLPEGFNYAGVMSFSGAILSRKGPVKYAATPCPTLMLHGTADKLVPYKQIAFFNLGFYGGGKLVKRFQKYGYDYNMYHFMDYGHEIAGSMYSTLDLQIDFLEKNVMQGKKRIIEAWISDPDVWKGAGPQSRKELYGDK
ncbi:MAG: alpha/beta hydrolase [Bacteroidales bacterium]|nr:alpha/beta hydrolase [Bacteroidales bacterium]